MSDRFTSLGEVINAAVDFALRDLRTCIPAKVVKWDASKCRADCQILVKNVTEDEEGKRQVSSFPVVPGVAVQFQGANGFRLTCPISDGSGGTDATIGTLFFSFRSLDKWLSGSGKEVDPELDHAHALADAIFMPGLLPFGAPWQSVPADEMSIGDDADGNGRIHFASGEVKLGDGATKEVARKGDGVHAGYIKVVAPVGGGDCTITYTPYGSAPVGTAMSGGEITEGSGHIKAVD